jgi:hypothetical protein
VTETPRALDLLVEGLAACGPARATWYFDSPVSNSGTLAGLLRRRFEELGLDWEAKLVAYADRHVSGSGLISVSADSGVLDAAERWFDLSGWVIGERVPSAWRIELATAAVGTPVAGGQGDPGRLGAPPMAD